MHAAHRAAPSLARVGDPATARAATAGAGAGAASADGRAPLRTPALPLRRYRLLLIAGLALVAGWCDAVSFLRSGLFPGRVTENMLMLGNFVEWEHYARDAAPGPSAGTGAGAGAGTGAGAGAGAGGIGSSGSSGSSGSGMYGQQHQHHHHHYGCGVGAYARDPATGRFVGRPCAPAPPLLLAAAAATVAGSSAVLGGAFRALAHCP